MQYHYAFTGLEAIHILDGMRGICIPTMVFTALGFFIMSSPAFSGTITTSVTCSFEDQAAVSDPNSCSMIQESSAPDNRSYASANSSANYGVSGNTLTVSFSQSLYIQEGGFLTYPYDPDGSVTADGTIDLTLEIAGSGTGLVQVLTPSLGGRDDAGEDDSWISFSLAGFGMNCGIRPDNACYFPPFPSIPFPLGTPFNFSMSESSYGSVDDANPLSAVSGTTTFEFIFDPISVDPPLTDVPEPRTAALVIAAALLFGCWRSLGRRKESVILD